MAIELIRDDWVDLLGKAKTVVPRDLAKYPNIGDPLVKWTHGQHNGVCVCCGSSLDLNFFPEVPRMALGYTQQIGESITKKRGFICKDCLAELYNFLDRRYKGNKFKVFYFLCSYLGFYYDPTLAKDIIENGFNLKSSGAKNPQKIRAGFRLFWAYMQVSLQNEILKNNVFDLDASINFETVNINSEKSGQTSLADLPEKDRKNRAAILQTYHFDPFENEELKDRIDLMEDLLTMTDDSMADDLVRQKAAIEIVRSFKRIDKMNQALLFLQKDPQTMVQNAKEIKDLLDQKTKETQMVTTFSKDHGFAERYANNKSKGAGTLGAILRDVVEGNYDKCAANAFDSETAVAMKQVADISAESIFKQLQFSATDYADMVKEQAKMIRAMQGTMDKQAEELRLYKEKSLKQELMEELAQELKEKGLSDEEIQISVRQELDYEPISNEELYS